MVLVPPLRRVGVLTGMVMPDGTTALRVGVTWTLVLKLTKKVWDVLVKGMVTVHGPVPLTYDVLLVTLTPFLVTLERVKFAAAVAVKFFAVAAKPVSGAGPTVPEAEPEVTAML